MLRNAIKSPQVITAITSSCLGLILSNSAATAASITFEQSFSSGFRTLLDQRDYSISTGIRFDPSLGTLNAVIVEGTVRGQGTYDAGVSVSINGTTGELLLRQLSASLFAFPGIFNPGSFVATPSGGDSAVGFSGTATFAFSGPGVIFDEQRSFSLFYASPETLAEIVRENAPVGLSASFRLDDFSGVAVSRLSLSSSISGTVRVTYDYTPIPTPALLPGLVGFGLAAWRSRKTVPCDNVN